MKRTIFVVEDDPDISRLVKHHLEAAGIAARVFSNSKGVIADAMRQHPSAFLLDIMIPGEDGMELCRHIRASGQLARIPIIFLTAKTEESDRLAGFDLGADDYITKPFSPRELVARVKAVLRRFEPPLTVQKIRMGELEIDSGAMSVEVAGKPVTTTATEFRLLEYFASRPGRVFTREQLLDAVWRDTSYVTLRSVDVYVRRIREKIENDAENPRFLRTVRGVGYRFEAPK
ncbi:MAG TPA: response regulator transcription factor [Terriglobales bacterium]|nr:response regulator transcription factor [Terriglobales bacterium]